ncbi:hypothetical protein EVAR_54652_1 [Eumeta japonica]|uniref:Uncharacterized protein n=1 Tax=Eumeta variegata TaxID=151549 RepID=A0A4C1XAD3_EUMVA|nr:hypothetical protein EVAR_54652_1 [Eumeta japonica]
MLNLGPLALPPLYPVEHAVTSTTLLKRRSPPIQLERWRVAFVRDVQPLSIEENAQIKSLSCLCLSVGRGLLPPNVPDEKSQLGEELSPSYGGEETRDEAPAVNASGGHSTSSLHAALHAQLATQLAQQQAALAAAVAAAAAAHHHHQNNNVIELRFDREDDCDFRLDAAFNANYGLKVRVGVIMIGSVPNKSGNNRDLDLYFELS